MCNLVNYLMKITLMFGISIKFGVCRVVFVIEKVQNGSKSLYLVKTVL